MASALGGFVEGLQGGMKFRQDSKRAKKLDRLLDQEGRKQAMALEGQQNDINNVRAAKGLSPRDFSTFGADPDPYDFKLGDFFKPRKLWQNFKQNAGFGGSTEQNSPVVQNEAAIEDFTAGADASSLGMQGSSDDMNRNLAADGGVVRMANGGSISTARTAANTPGWRGAIPRYVAQQGGARNLLNNSKLAKGGGALAAGMAINDQLDEDYDERMNERFGDWGWGGEDDGEASLGGAAEFFTKRALGFASDLGDKLTMGQASRFYRDEDSPERAAIAASDVGAQPAQEEQAPTDIGELPTMEVRGTPPEAPQRAIDESFGGPAEMANAPITNPTEMPTMNTEEWVAYRAASVENMLLRGATLPEAHDAITGMQQKGFLNYGTQALQLLAAGDPLRASMALKAAYQYFPNGADVSFGITKDKSGQPALIAMGKDEQTGEPIPQGTMLLTGERLAVMMENMTNPDAFRSWTKDWREFEQELREYYEVEKPTAQSEASYRDRMGRAALNRSEADLYAAQNTGVGGLKQSDIDRGLSAIEEILGDAALMREIPEPDLDYLSEVAALVYQHQPGNSTATIRSILSAYREGGTAAVDQLIRGE